MFGMLGLLGVLVAGLAMPMAFGEDPEPEEDGPDPALDREAAPEPPEGRGDDNGDAPDEDSAEPDADILRALPETLPQPPEEDEDVLIGTDADDDILGDAGSDLILAGSGNDAADGGPGNDKLQGAEGNDTLWGDFGDDHLAGEAGDDLLIDGAGTDTLDGGAGNDTLIATTADGEDAADGRDELHGGAGDDVLILSNHDHATGGAGGDTFYVGPGIGPADPAAAPQIGDFDPAQDSLVVVWNDFAAEAPPSIEVAPAEDPGTVQVLADGAPVAHLTATGPVAAQNITLLAASRFV